MMSRAFSAFAALAILGLAAASVRAQEHGGKVVDHAWVKAVSAGDIEAAVALYSPDAVLYAPDSMEARGTELFARFIRACSDLTQSPTPRSTRPIRRLAISQLAGEQPQ